MGRKILVNNYAALGSQAQIQSQLAGDGWRKADAGHTSGIDLNTRFDLYRRTRKISSFLEHDTCDRSGKAENIPPQSDAEKSCKTGTFQAGSDALLDGRAGIRTPAADGFSSLPSIAAIRSEREELVIGFDTEFYGSPRNILSWQFCVVVGDSVKEFVFLRKVNANKAGDFYQYNLSLEYALACILDDVLQKPVRVDEVRRFAAITGIRKQNGKPLETSFLTYREAEEAGKYWYINRTPTTIRADVNPGGRIEGSKSKVRRYRDFSKTGKTRVTLVCHGGKADLSAFDQSGWNSIQVLNCVKEIQGGLVSLYPVLCVIPSTRQGRYDHYCYPVSLSFRDTMGHAPGKEKRLAVLGETIGVKKVVLPGNSIRHMEGLLDKDPCLYMNYASQAAVIALLYCASLYGYNKEVPITITSAGAKVIKSSICEYLGITKPGDFNPVYRGLKRVYHGQLQNEETGKLQAASSEEPLNDHAASVQRYAKEAYHGGYNASSEIGYFGQPTYDYDLKNAYPTAMCLVPDVDWTRPVRKIVTDRYITLEDFNGCDPESLLMFCCCSFEFPKSVMYPCIPVVVDGIPVFPRTSEGFSEIYAAGPEIYLALCLGASVYVHNGYFLNPLKHGDDVSYSLRSAVKQLVTDRAKAVEMFGKGSLEEQIIKTMVNSGYGKIAQNVVEKQHWDSYRNRMDDIGCSSITNPVSASMTTSIIRAVLIAAQNECGAAGYMACSVTTDGFISDIPYNNLTFMDLYGFRELLSTARLFLTDGANRTLWECKHTQNDLLNFTTRGNVSLEDGGVCAHNGCPSPYASKSEKDRRWLMLRVLLRTGPVKTTVQEWSRLKDLQKGIEDFTVHKVEKQISQDFDMKRKPDRDSFFTDRPLIEGRQYEIAHFSTLPYESAAEFEKYRQTAKTCNVLRTCTDWELFWQKLEIREPGIFKRIKELSWTKLVSVIMGYRAGLWDIPAFDGLSVKEKCDYINSLHICTKQFTPNDWKNCRRPERQAAMLPAEQIQDILILLLGKAG